MECCTGGALTTAMARAHTSGCYVVPSLARHWLGHIFLGLEHLNLSLDILVRDLKPDNVVLDGEGVAKIIDFGFSKAARESRGSTFGVPAGSPGYVAPELIKEGRHDRQADLYSYGVVCWQLLTGERPPIHERAHHDWRLCADDWRQLTHRVSTAPPPACEDGELARSLIRRLVREDARTRPSHVEVRADRFLRPLKLPFRLLGATGAREWLESLRRS